MELTELAMYFRVKEDPLKVVLFSTDLQKPMTVLTLTWLEQYTSEDTVHGRDKTPQFLGLWFHECVELEYQVGRPSVLESDE